MTRKTKRKAPEWFTDFFEIALDRHQRLSDALDVSASGISVQRRMPHLMKALETAGSQIEEGKMESAQKRASFAKEEVKAHYPTLAGFGTLAMWSWLEAFVLDFCVLWVRKRPSALKNLPGPKIKVDLGEYARLSAEERARFVIDALDRELSGPLKRGPARFENLLAAIGLPIALTGEDKKTLFEFQMFRNCLAHRLGIVDGKLKEHCPWVKDKIGQPLSIKFGDFHRFSEAAGTVLLQTLYAGGDAYGIDLRSIDKKAGAKANAKEAN